MPGFNSVKQLVEAQEQGSSTYTTFRKSPVQVTTAGIWFDLSMSPGNPIPNYYAAAPLTSIALKQSTDGGIYHGAYTSQKDKFLHQLLVLSNSATGLPMPMLLCDYVLYYPFIDEGTLDAQPLTNSVALPRYSTGQGLQMMAVSVASRTGGQTFQVTYTNQDGTAGRVTSIVVQNTQVAVGNIVTAQTATVNAVGPFIPLQSGDTGVRSIDSVQMISGTDVGLFTLVLVKPLATIQIIEQTAAVETDFLRMSAQLPKIEDDAYLNFLCLPQGSLSGVSLHGELKTISN